MLKSKLLGEERRNKSLDIEGERKDDPLDRVPSISYRTLYRFATRSDRIMICISFLGVIIAGLTVPLAISLVADTFQNMITYSRSVKNGTAEPEMFLSKMHAFGIKYFCIGFVSFIGAYLGSALINVTAVNQIHQIRLAYLKAALNQDVAYYDERSSGDFASRMADDVIKMGQGIGDKVSACVYSLTVGCCCITMAVAKGWKLALLCFSYMPLILAMVATTGWMANRFAKKQALASSKASAVAQEALSSIRTVYSFNGQEKELAKFKKPLAEERKTCIKREFFSGISIGFLMFCVFSSYGLFFYLGIYLIINDPANYNADVIFSVFFGVMTAVTNFGMSGSLVGTLFGSARGSGAYIFHLVDSVPTINTLADAGKKPKNAQANIELKNVVFHYPSRPAVQVLKGVNLTVKHGQSVALVGKSGCGKSSIVQLISRFYDVIDGNITLDGHDIRTLSVRWLRARVGLVCQEPVLFNVSVRDNIRYGRDDATDDDIEAAARISNAHNFIVKLPKGYDTTVGDGGASLSGGQKQRIAIARALVRNPLILLLDEATSALDARSEAMVQVALSKASEGRTTLIVAHRLSTIRNVDVIYAMKDGQIFESGSHDELIAKKGLYYDMITMQDPDAIWPTQETNENKISIEESKVSEDQFFSEDVKTVLAEDKETKAPKLSFWRVVRLNSPEWKAITIGSIGSIFVGFSMPLFIIVFGDVFGLLSDSDTNKLWQKVKQVSVIFVLIGVVMGVSNVLEAGSFGIAAAYLTERLRVGMFAHMLRQHLAYFDERVNSTGALCARLSGEAAAVQGATGQRIGLVLQAVGSIGLALAISIVYEWRVVLVVLAFWPIILLVIYYQAKATHKESCGNAETLENSTKIAVEAVSNIRTVVSLGREDKFLAEYMSQLEPTLPLARRAAHLSGLLAGISRSMFIFVNSIALTYGGHLIVSDGVPCQNILVTTQALQIPATSAQNALTFAPDFKKALDAASRIVAFLQTKPNIQDPETPTVTKFVSEGEASMRGVEFRYPSRPNVPVLCGLDLNVESGKTIALVGRSGCGKTTIIQLLQRFYDPDKGSVCLDGYPLPELSMSDVRASFGIVSQEPVLFSGTIRENIQYGDNSRCPSFEEVVNAAKLANIHDFIAQLPMGYDTEIGSKGVQLSGGQKQRVSIARALVRNPKILLLDEATSALDVESEKVVTEALSLASAGRTCVVVAHRTSTVRAAARVCVLRAGRVLEAGTHDQLLRAKGEYASLYRPTTE